MSPRFAAAVVFVVTLAGCGTAPDTGQAGRDAGDPESSERPAGSPGKAGASVALDYELLGEPALGQPLEIRVSLVPAVGADRLEVNFSGDQNLAVEDAVATLTQTEVPAGRATEHTLIVTPQQSGVSYVNVFATTENEAGSRMVRTFAIPIQVGPAAAVEPEALKTDAEGQPIVSMPAEETP